MILLLLSNVIEKSCDYMIIALKVWIVNKLHVHHMNEVDEIMVLEMYVCYIWLHDIMYSCICAPYRICCTWAKNDGIIVIICAYITQSFTPHRIVLWSGSIWVAWQPHQQCGLSVGGSSPREVPNPSALPCDDRMSDLVLRDRSLWMCQR